MDKKIIFIPGWMYSPNYFKLGDGIDIWQKNVDLDVRLECDYLVGHSMGAAVALKIWLSNRDKKLILVDPFIEQKNFWDTFVRWWKFFWHEGIKSTGALGIGYFPRNLKKLLMFSKEDYWEILKNVPRENVKVLHGENDLFLCGQDVCSRIKSLGVEVIEVFEAGHDWHKKFEEEILKIVNK